MRFLFVGIGSHRKGTDLLLLAMDRLLPKLDFQLTLVGPTDDSFLSRMRAQTSSALWERVTMHKYLQPAQIVQEMERATMVLFPTRVDNSPNSVKEAVVAGVPVVASAVGGIIDYVVPGKNGFTFPPGDLEGLVAGLQAAVSHPLFSQGKVDSATLKEKKEYLSAKVMGDRFFATYQTVQQRTHSVPIH